MWARSAVLEKDNLVIQYILTNSSELLLLLHMVYVYILLICFILKSISYILNYEMLKSTYISRYAVIAQYLILKY